MEDISKETDRLAKLVLPKAKRKKKRDWQDWMPTRDWRNWLHVLAMTFVWCAIINVPPAIVDQQTSHLNVSNLKDSEKAHIHHYPSLNCDSGCTNSVTLETTPEVYQSVRIDDGTDNLWPSRHCIMPYEQGSVRMICNEHIVDCVLQICKDGDWITNSETKWSTTK